jgi:beta-galactosidase GanA
MQREEFIPIAVWYTGGKARATMVRPPDEDSQVTWKKDLETIKSCGFNTVRCWVDWATAEPQPGEYHFETLDLLMDLAEEVGLKVIIQIYLDSAPDWLVKYFPDCRYVSAGGVPIDSQGAPGYCYDHPGVHSAAERFMVTLAGRVAQRPCFLGWDLWSEPHIVQWGYFDYLPQPAVFCYCNHTVQRFRDWLQRRYGTIGALNTAWYRQFSSWDTIPAPKFISLMTYTEYIDWIHFIQEKLAEDLSWRQNSVRQADQHIATSHSAVPMVLTNPLDEQGSPDDWKMAKAVEVWGTSLYPKHVGAKETKHAFFRAAMLTSTRSACDSVGAPYWLGELQAGHGYVGMFASHMTAQDARQYLLQPLAHGAKGLCFYAWYPMSSGYESAGFGMANLDGSPSDRALAAGELTQKVSADMGLFYRAKPVKADVAVCLNNYSNIMWQCMRQPWHYIPSRSYVGAYKAIHQKYLPADYIHPDEISQGKLEKYRVLYLPFSFMLPRQAAAQIAQFVEQGGVVLAEARTAWNDETGYCGDAVPGFGLEKVFGCREKGAEGVGEDARVPVRIICNHPALPTLQEGDILQGAFFREALELLSADAELVGVFEDGSPAITVHRYGKGWAVFAGTMLSLAYYKFDDINTGKFLQGLLDLAQIDQPVELGNVPEGVEIEPRLLEFQDDQGKIGYLFFAFNHTESDSSSITMEPLNFALRLATGNYQVSDVVREQTVPSTWSDGRLQLQTVLHPGEIWLVKILST